MINGVTFHLAMSQPIVSTGAGNRERISLMASYVSCQRVGAGRGFSRASLIALGLFGDAADSDDDVCADGRLVGLPFTFPLRVDTLAASPGNSSSPPPQNTIPSVLAMSALTRFEQRAGDDSRPSPDSGLLSGMSRLPWSSSLNKVTERPQRSVVNKTNNIDCLRSCTAVSPLEWEG